MVTIGHCQGGRRSSEHPWVLLAHPVSETSAAVSAELRSQGYEVFLCAGPEREHSCPLLDTGECAVARAAEVVVHGFDRNNLRGEQLVVALAASYPDLPVVFIDRRGDTRSFLPEYPDRRGERDSMGDKGEGGGAG